MIKIIDLSVNYGEKSVISHLNAEFSSGKITAILGESGAGKTTLLNAVAGIVRYDGKIEGVNGKISYLFQEARLVPNLTVGENLKLVRPDLSDGDVKTVLYKTGLAGYSERMPETLSGGERQRVSIARAFLYDGDLLLLDEPFSSLDIKNRLNLTSLLLSLIEKSGKTVIAVTHDVNFATDAADDIFVFKDGAMLKIPSRSAYGRDLNEKERIKRETEKLFIE